MRRLVSLLVLATACVASGAAAAVPGHLEGYVPVVSRGAGAFDSFWTTDLWIYTQSATVIHLWFNPSGSDNSDQQSVVVPLDGAVTHVGDAVGTVFEASGKGSLHYLADGPVVVVSKTWTPGKSGGTYGQVITGLPLTVASTPDTGQAGSLRMVVAKAQDFRANLGLTNVTGVPATVTVDAFDHGGAPLAGAIPFSVALAPFDMQQVDDVLARLSTTSRPGIVVRATVSSTGGAILAYLSEVDNFTNSGAYQEAFRFGY